MTPTYMETSTATSTARTLAEDKGAEERANDFYIVLGIFLSVVFVIFVITVVCCYYHKRNPARNNQTRDVRLWSMENRRPRSNMAVYRPPRWGEEEEEDEERDQYGNL